MPEARKASPKGTSRLGLFRPVGPTDSGRPATPEPIEVSDNAGTFDGNIREELQRLMRLPAAYLATDPDKSIISAGALFAFVLLQKAIIEKNQTSLTEVMDRLEGKASKAAANKPSNAHIADQLELSIDDLNKL